MEGRPNNRRGRRRRFIDAVRETCIIPSGQPNASSTFEMLDYRSVICIAGVSFASLHHSKFFKVRLFRLRRKSCGISCALSFPYLSPL